jgi:hypothetical protein
MVGESELGPGNLAPSDGTAKADKAHPAPLARQIARKAEVRLSSPRMVCWSERSFLASFPAAGLLQGPRYLGRPRYSEKARPAILQPAVAWWLSLRQLIAHAHTHVFQEIGRAIDHDGRPRRT